MTDYKLYPNLPPSAPPENPQVAYHLSIIQAKMQGLQNKEQMFNRISTGGKCFPCKFCLPVDNVFSFGSIATKFGDFS